LKGNEARGGDDTPPRFKDEALVAAPSERLFHYGRWHSGLLPLHGLDDENLLEVHRFEDLMERFKGAKGADGKPAFAIPMELSSNDQEFLQLDAISFADYLVRENLRSTPSTLVHKLLLQR
jgi:hypothetical protein